MSDTNEPDASDRWKKFFWTCKHCKVVNTIDDNRCWNCGQDK